MATDYTVLLRSGQAEDFVDAFGDLGGHVAAVRSMARKMAKGESLSVKEQAIALYLTNISDPAQISDNAQEALEKQDALQQDLRIDRKLLGAITPPGVLKDYGKGINTAFISSKTYRKWVEAGTPGEADIGFPTGLGGKWMAPTYTGTHTTSALGQVEPGITVRADGTAVNVTEDGNRTEGYIDPYGRFVEGPGPAPGDGPKYLGGFPEGYAVDRYQPPEDVADLQRLYKGGRPALVQPRPPKYVEWQNVAMFAGTDPVYINQVQLTMWEAGFIDKEDITPGFWGKPEQDAMYDLMFEAQGNAMSWLEVAEAHIKAGTRKKKEAREGPKAQPFVQEPYLKPDYDNLAAAVRRTVTGTIGRQPEDWEMALLAEQLDADYRAQYEAETQANRAYHDAGNRALLSDTDQASGEVQTVDPLSSLSERVYDRYRNEIDFGERKAEHAYSVQRMMNTLTGLERVVGG